MSTLKLMTLLVGIIFLIGVIGVVILGLKDPEGDDPTDSEKKELPTYSPTLGWRRAEPGEVGLKGDILADMVLEIRVSSTQTRSSLVVKDGYLIARAE